MDVLNAKRRCGSLSVMLLRSHHVLKVSMWPGFRESQTRSRNCCLLSFIEREARDRLLLHYPAALRAQGRYVRHIRSQRAWLGKEGQPGRHHDAQHGGDYPDASECTLHGI